MKPYRENRYIPPNPKKEPFRMNPNNVKHISEAAVAIVGSLALAYVVASCGKSCFENDTATKNVKHPFVVPKDGVCMDLLYRKDSVADPYVCPPGMRMAPSQDWEVKCVCEAHVGDAGP